MDYVFAGTFSFNGNGETTGLPWIAERCMLGCTDRHHQHLIQVAGEPVRDAHLSAAVPRRSPQPSTSRSSPRPMTAG